MNRFHALIPILLAAQYAVAAPIDDPWALVPELPNSCYTEQDEFATRSNAAMDTHAAEIERQGAINSAISEQIKSLDPMEVQQRMMNFMMEHPEDAVRIKQGMLQARMETGEGESELNARRQQLEHEFNELSARYRADYQNSVGTLESRRQESVRGERGAFNESDAILLVQEMNAAYEGLCQTWWKNGPFHAWLPREKALLIEDAAALEKIDSRTVDQGVMLGIPAEGYRSTASLSAAHEFLRRANEVFSKRNRAPEIFQGLGN